jgi:exosortase A-associated hydrolase 2
MLRVGGRFIDGAAGPLALLVWEPPHGEPCRFAVLYVPPALDEMNRSRRMAALQARAFTRLGGVVALLDPFGTGDSAGEHAEATWERWRADVALAWAWLGAQTQTPRVVWGLRLGALLAAELVAEHAISPELLLLWQPVLSGRTFFNQLLRVAVAQQMTGATSERVDAESLRARLDAGTSIEVAGYELHPQLVLPASAVDASRLAAPSCPVLWFETAPGDAPTVAPASASAARAWTERGTQVDIAAVKGPSFWMTQEIEEAPALIEATTRALTARLRESARSPS